MQINMYPRIYCLLVNKFVIITLMLQVVELGQMQDLLSENVDLQATQIDKIQETIIAATENVREGNEQVSTWCIQGLVSFMLLEICDS